MKDQAVSSDEYKRCLHEQFRIHHVHNYYGMAEQTGSIYMECEAGHLHASIFSDILIRNPKDFLVALLEKRHYTSSFPFSHIISGTFYIN